MSLRRSPLFYVGDKFKLVPQIKPLLPPFISRFVEPFAGGASMAMNSDAQEIFLNDANPLVIGLHEWIASYAESGVAHLLSDIERRVRDVGLHSSFFGDEVPSALKAALPKTYFAELNRTAYLRLREGYNAAGAKDPLDLYILVIFGFNRMIRVNGKGEFNVPVGNVDFNANAVAALTDYLSWVRSSNVFFSSTGYKDAIDSYGLTKGDFVYFDPPYLIAEAEYNRSWSVDHENQLLDYLDQLSDAGVKWALSNVTNYKGRINSALVDWAENYSLTELQARYLSYRGNSGNELREVLIRNYA